MINLGCAHQSSSLYPCGIPGLMDVCSWGCFWLILVIAARMLWFITFTPSYWLPGIMNLTNCPSRCPPLPLSFQSSSLSVFEDHHEANWTCQPMAQDFTENNVVSWHGWLLSSYSFPLVTLLTLSGCASLHCLLILSKDLSWGQLSVQKIENSYTSWPKKWEFWPKKYFFFKGWLK